MSPHPHIATPAKPRARTRVGKSRARVRGKPRPVSKREQGVALVLVLTVVAVITVLVSELSQNTTTAFQTSISERDRLKAEYIARSGLNLTRLLIAKEPAIRAVISPFYQMMLKHGPPQINVWAFADQILAPFGNYKAAKAQLSQTGIDFGQMQGLTDTGGSFETSTIPENSMINVNKPLFFTDPNDGARSIAQQLYSVLGGYQQQSPYDAMFNSLDADGQQTTRLDILSDIIDWWDYDDQRTVFDPGTSQVTSAGSEDNIYSQFVEPYKVKNAPYDSLEELRLIRGVSDDFWATFVEPDSSNPRGRRMTVYGSGAVNPNEASPAVLIARICSFVPTQPMCATLPMQLAFIQLLGTVRLFLPVPLFESPDAFVSFVQGKGDVYTMLSKFLGGGAGAAGGLGASGGGSGAGGGLLAWTPIVVPPDQQKNIVGAFVTAARIFTIQSVGRVGHTEFRSKSVINFDPSWTPPPLTTGRMAGLGIYHHYRVD